MSTRRSIPWLMVLAGIVTPAALALGAAPRPVRLAVIAHVDGNRARGAIRGADEVEARSDIRNLARVTAAWPSGVSSRIPWWRRDTRVASYVLVVGKSERLAGNLWARGVTRSRRTARRQVTLRPRGSSSPTVLVRARPMPELDITDLPPGTHSIQIDTVGAGRRVLNFSARCRDHGKVYRWRMTVRYRNGVPTSRRHGSVDISC